MTYPKNGPKDNTSLGPFYTLIEKERTPMTDLNISSTAREAVKQSKLIKTIESSIFDVREVA